MRAGILRHVIEIYSPVHTNTEFGALSNTMYEFVRKTRADIEFTGGQRELDNGEIFYSNAVTFTIRSYNNIDEEMVIHFKGKRYRIISIEPVERYAKKKVLTELINE